MTGTQVTTCPLDHTNRRDARLLAFQVTEELECEKVNELDKADHTATDTKPKGTAECSFKGNLK
jgi:hypothetical protein